MQNYKVTKRFKIDIRSLLLALALIFFACGLLFAQELQDLKEIKLPPKVRFIRAYGGIDETKPPIVIKPVNTGINPSMGESAITIEFDVASDVPPVLYTKFVHCKANWEEDDNVFLNDIAFHRTSNITWEAAPISSKYYSYRGRLSVPNDQVKFNYSGNWKAKVYELGYEDNILAETRFFVVEPKADCSISLYSDFYEPFDKRIAPSGITAEAVVQAPQTLMDNMINTVVFYRNHRWYEPFVISTNSDYEDYHNKYKYKFNTQLGGIASVGKVFRIEGIPAENGYRVLDLANLAEFPRTTAPTRLPLSDLRRSGSYMFDDDDGALVTSYITPSMDEYAYVEFVMDPDNFQTDEDVFISGSFNNWNPNKDWQMYYDTDQRLYTLRQWVRRGRNDYLYATGKYNADTDKIEDLSYDEFEGNTVMTSHTYIAFVYYRDISYGGYDALIGVGAANIYGSIRK